MNQAVRFSLLLSVMCNYLLLSTQAAGCPGEDACSKDINFCLFNGWGNVLVKGRNRVSCKGYERTGLCYGSKLGTLFAVCYNTKTLIPEFTGHIVEPASKRASGRDVWRIESGKFAPNPQSNVFSDYDPYRQRGTIPNFNEKQNLFYSRRHLTPNSDFGRPDERGLTMVNTNIAPQWQAFNGGNWATLEDAVRRYSDANNRRVFVFTGTGGIRMNDKGVPVVINRRVFVPIYFWKAVCDPVLRSSVVFVAENPNGAGDNKPKGGCNPGTAKKPNRQTPNLGVIYCYSLDSMKSKKNYKEFKLPPFSDVCKPSARGTFLDKYLSFQ